MIENRVETSRTAILPNFEEITMLEKWFRFEYPERLSKIQRYEYLGLPLNETRYGLEIEAYEKENKLRVLKGLEKLPEIKYKKII